MYHSVNCISLSNLLSFLFAIPIIISFIMLAHGAWLVAWAIIIIKAMDAIINKHALR